MPTVTHTLEGPDLESLLARVPQELGPDATIVAANKLRSGGFAGFFAKEVFEVVVEVPEGARRPIAVPDAAGETPGRTRRRAPLTADSTQPEAKETAVATAARKPAASQPRISTEEVGFAGVLDRMVRDAGLDDYAPRPIGPVLNDPGRTNAEDTSILDLDSTDDTDGTDSVTAEEEPFVHGFPGLTAPASQPIQVEPVPLAVPEAPRSVLTVLPAPATAPLVVEAPAPASPAPIVAPTAPVASAPTAIVAAEPLLPAAPTGLDRALLARIGIPAALLQDHDAVQDDPTVELLRLMARLQAPAALPSGQGSVIAVVGPRAAALELATALAAQVGSDPDDVIIATSRGRVAKIDESRRIDSVDAAAERCRSWRRRRRPTIVAVESPYGRRQTSWAMDLLDAIEPAMVWGVVEATSKPEDIATWAERVGGVDALAVNGLADTSSPAAVLSTGVPVGLLDGEEATPLRWTSILAEHLELAA